jgi:signal peptidase I
MYEEMIKRIYLGNSMRGIFTPGDIMLLLVVSHTEIIPGDVIVFRKAHQTGSNEMVVHRVVGIVDCGFITRGDNNLRCDMIPVFPEQIVGKVIAVQKGDNTKPVQGGFIGLRKANLSRLFLLLNLYIRHIFRRYYTKIRVDKFLARLWKPKTQRIRLQTETGMLIKYLYRDRTVATWDPARQRFDCRKPFDLVIPSPLEEKQSPTHAKLD